MTTSKAVRALPNAHNIARETLPNGLTVLVYENHHTQSVVLSGSLHAGSIYEAPGRGGLAGLTAAALMRGTVGRDFGALHSQLEDIGADLGYSYGPHKVGFSGKALAEDLPLLVDLLADTLRAPAFPADGVERLRGERLTMLGYREQDTRWQAGRAFRENLYPAAHPYHHSSSGTLESLPTLTLDEIRDFHRRVYGPRDMILVIVGAVDAAAAIETVGRHLGDWSNPDQPNPPALPALDPPAEARRVHIPVSGKTQSDIVLGTLGPPRSAADFYAVRLANSVLGQFGMMGRIGDVVREREGLAYYAYSRVEGGYGPGPWSVVAGVNPANVERAVELCLGEIERITSEPVSAEDLDDNQAFFVGRMPLQLETNEGMAGTLHNIEAYGLGLNYLLQHADIIRALTADDLLAAARKYLHPDRLVIASAGPLVSAGPHNGA